MMLLGDLNCSTGSSPINELRTKWSAGNFDYGIDWILFRPANRWRFISARKPNTGEAAIASDHLPVETIMELIIPQTGIENNGLSAALLHAALKAVACRGRISVSYLLEAGTHVVKADLFNIHGQCLKSVCMSGSREGGRHTLSIPLEGFPGQLYIVRMEIDGKITVARVSALGSF
jgi:hypothetical protein